MYKKIDASLEARISENELYERVFKSKNNEIAILKKENELLGTELKAAGFEVMRLQEERKEYKQRLKEKFIARGFSGNDWNTNIIMDIIDNFKFPEAPNTTLTKEQMRQQEDLSEQREEYD